LILLAFGLRSLVSDDPSERLLNLSHKVSGGSFNAILVHRRSPLVLWKKEAIRLFGDLNGTEATSFLHHRTFAEQPHGRGGGTPTWIERCPRLQKKEDVVSNPWMSVWLSAANAWVGVVRGFWAAEIRRQQTSVMNEMARQVTRFWQGSSVVPIAAKRKRARR
jgi:hypothetical protein